jgi:hypothetical protein
LDRSNYTRIRRWWWWILWQLFKRRELLRNAYMLEPRNRVTMGWLARLLLMMQGVPDRRPKAGR